MNSKEIDDLMSKDIILGTLADCAFNSVESLEFEDIIINQKKCFDCYMTEYRYIDQLTSVSISDNIYIARASRTLKGRHDYDQESYNITLITNSHCRKKSVTSSHNDALYFINTILSDEDIRSSLCYFWSGTNEPMDEKEVDSILLQPYAIYYKTQSNLFDDHFKIHINFMNYSFIDSAEGKKIGLSPDLTVLLSKFIMRFKTCYNARYHSQKLNKRDQNDNYMFPGLIYDNAHSMIETVKLQVMFDKLMSSYMTLCGYASLPNKLYLMFLEKRQSLMELLNTEPLKFITSTFSETVSLVEFYKFLTRIQKSDADMTFLGIDYSDNTF
jgi:hypothetical protein